MSYEVQHFAHLDIEELHDMDIAAGGCVHFIPFQYLWNRLSDKEVAIKKKHFGVVKSEVEFLEKIAEGFTFSPKDDRILPAIVGNEFGVVAHKQRKVARVLAHYLDISVQLPSAR